MGKFHVEPELQQERFQPAFSVFGIREFMFLSTCNRVEFFFRALEDPDEDFIQRFLSFSYPSVTPEEIDLAVENARIYSGLDAIRHIFHVASSLDSLVVGEREIITQVRSAYDRAHDNGFTGDFIRIAIRKTIETAKQVYTETEIATKPISIVNLGYRKLLERDLSSEHSVAFIGAGQTIEAIAGNLKEFRFREIKVFNRTSEKAEKLAGALGGSGYALEDIKSQLGQFDMLITCTGSEQPIIDAALYERLHQESPGKKVILDLAVPTDIDPAVVDQFEIDYISVGDLKEEARQNLKEREKEIFHCEALVEERLAEFEEAVRTRKLEIAMSEVPRLMKEIKSNALDKTFARDIQSMDETSQETLVRILDYLEKKYISVPMKMAKQVMLDQDLKDPVIE